MREIIFRGKWGRNGCCGWIEGCLVAAGCVAFILRPVENTTILEEFEVAPATVGQYTGIRDKDGKRIFEGDVLRITDRFGKFVDWRVKFRKGAFSVKHPDCNYWCGIGEFGGYTLEVIGNIHDNPELLEANV